MELYQLRTFAAVAEAGHLTRAAERLHLSQPAVSGHIKALEQELDVRLFERASTGMTLTEAGRQLLAHAQKVLSAADGVKLAAKQLHGALSGLLRVGTVADPVDNRLGAVLSAAVQRHPLLRLDLHQTMSGTALESVRDGRLDATFYFGDAPTPPLAALPLRQLIYRVAAPAAWTSKVKDARWPEIAALPWVRTPTLSTHTQLVSQLFAAHGLEPPEPAVLADDETVITSLVASGLGVALVRDEVARARAEEGELAVWPGAAIETTLWFVYPAARADEPAIAALIGLVREAWNLSDKHGPVSAATIT
ncbi:MAG TPA: LysR family transcriptional regulator [Burkholderiaceae bacterium]|nr:LysR family transcriptional regulator [Burkholderiaceae bacterium]